MTAAPPTGPGMTPGSAMPGARSGRSLVFMGLLVAVLALLAVLAWAVRQATVVPQMGRPAPDFALTTYDGQNVRLRDLRGQVVLLNFWASWCVPCAQEARDLEAIARDYAAAGLVVVGVAYTDTEPAAREYLARHGVTYPNGPDRQGRISRAYGIAGVPETFVIDRAGRIAPLMVSGQPAAKLAGPISPTGALSSTDLRATLDRLVAEDA